MIGSELTGNGHGTNSRPPCSALSSLQDARRIGNAADSHSRAAPVSPMKNVELRIKTLTSQWVKGNNFVRLVDIRRF